MVGIRQKLGLCLVLLMMSAVFFTLGYWTRVLREGAGRYDFRARPYPKSDDGQSCPSATGDAKRLPLGCQCGGTSSTYSFPYIRSSYTVGIGSVLVRTKLRTSSVREK
jgi:hypothetical protein